MIDTQIYLDQLDILSTYMKYWIEFKDKERVIEENIPKNAIRSDFMSSVASVGFDIDVQFDNGSSGVFAPKKKTPTTFKSILKVHSELIKKNHSTPKQSVINSIQKFV